MASDVITAPKLAKLESRKVKNLVSDVPEVLCPCTHSSHAPWTPALSLLPRDMPCEYY